ncbi:probable protein phosphatase 2C 28 [Juglans microcarpa x Juglans regia]|uniref:probable protein phosphatase 2C 28 n=1 Tax=Juglans microcarpa x Juglans regia TaxID=2249226 RepID=UPI001B7E6DD3|nr:probable protein phosphatase 2C 28 [Juglans microcarpa x Juglans regia]
MKSKTKHFPEEILANKLKKRRLSSNNKLDGQETEEEGGHGGSIDDADDDNEEEFEAGHCGSIDDADYDNEEEFEAGHGTSIEETEDNDDGDPISQHLSHGFYLIKGKMDHQMEDYLMAETREVNGHELGLYAIFNGHSGRYVAKYLQSHLFDKILSDPNFWTNPKHSIKAAYEVTDDEILGRVGSRGGSTAVTEILIDRETLIVANVGDSRAILCRNGVVKQITRDHEPTKEKQLVESRGGFVSEKPGNVARVDGQLSMTRAFGDGKLKEHITSEPDVKVEKIDKDTESIILASDGLWKVRSRFALEKKFLDKHF